MHLQGRETRKTEHEQKKRKDKWLNICKNANMNKNVEAIKFTKSNKTIEFGQIYVKKK